jgi:hypothetical protein
VESLRTRLPRGNRLAEGIARSSFRIPSEGERGRGGTGHFSSAAFGHVSRFVSAEDATVTCVRDLLRTVTRVLNQCDPAWPGLDFGPVEIRSWAAANQVHAEITDRQGASIQFPAVVIG